MDRRDDGRWSTLIPTRLTLDRKAKRGKTIRQEDDIQARRKVMAAESPPQLQNIQIETIGFTNLNNKNIVSEVLETQTLRKNTDNPDDREDNDITAVIIETPDEETYRPVITVTKNEITLTKPGAKLQKITVQETVDNVKDIEKEANSFKIDDNVETEYINLRNGRNIISEVPDGPFIIRSDKKRNNIDYNGDNINKENAVEASDRGDIQPVNTESRESDDRLEEDENNDNDKPEIEVKEQEEEVVYNKPFSKLPKRIPVKSQIKKEITKNTKSDSVATAQDYLPPNAYIGRPNIFSETPSTNHILRHEPPPKPVSKIPKLNKHEVKPERKIPILSKRDTKTAKDPVYQTDNAIKHKSFGKEKPVKEENKQKTGKTLKEKILKVVTIRNNGRPEVNSNAPKSPHEMRGNLEFKEKDYGENKIVVHRRPKEQKSNELTRAVVPVERNSIIIDQIINSQVPDEIDNIFDELYDSLVTEETLDGLEVSETPSNETKFILSTDESPRSDIKEDKPIQNSTHQYTILEINNTAEPFKNTSSREQDDGNRNIKPELIKEDFKANPVYDGNLNTGTIRKDRQEDVSKEYGVIKNINDNSNTLDKPIEYVKHGEELKVVHIDNDTDEGDIVCGELENKENTLTLSPAIDCIVENIIVLQEETINPTTDSLQTTREQVAIPDVLATPDQPPWHVQLVQIDLNKDFTEEENLASLVHEDSGIEPKLIIIKEPENELVDTNGTIIKIDFVNNKEFKENPTTDTKSEYMKETFVKDVILKPVDAPYEKYDTLDNSYLKKIEFDARNLPEIVPAEDKTDQIDRHDSPKDESTDHLVEVTDKCSEIATVEKPIEIPTKSFITEQIDTAKNTEHPVQVKSTTEYLKNENPRKPVNEDKLDEDIIIKYVQDNIEKNVINEEALEELNSGEHALSNDLENEEPEYESVYTPILTVTKEEIAYSTSSTKLQKITVTEKIEDPGRYLTMAPDQDNIELPVDETAKKPLSPVIDLSRPNYRETSRLKMREISDRSSTDSNRIETKGELKYKEITIPDATKDVYKPKIVDHVTKKEYKERDREFAITTEEKEKKGITGKVKDMIYRIANKKSEDNFKKETKERDNAIKETNESEDKPSGKVKNVLQRFESKEDLSEPVKKFIDAEPKPVNKKFRHILDRFENKTTDPVEEQPKKNRIEHKTFKNEEDLAREASRGKVQNILKSIESKRDIAISKGKSMENIADNNDFRRQFSRRKSVSETVAMFEVGKI